MEEREQLKAAREQLKSSFKAVYRDLKLYGVAVGNRSKAVLRNVGNNVVNAVQRLNNEIYIHKCNLEISRAEKKRQKAIERAEKLERENSRLRSLEHKKAMAKLLKEQDADERKSIREERRLNFKNGVKQKVSSFKSRLGRVKNSFLKAMRFENIDYKIRNAFERTQIFGLGTLNKGMTIANNAKDKVTNFTSEQISRYRMWRIERKERAAVKREETMVAREERKLKFKNGVKQKVSTSKSRLGRVKNSFLKAMRFENIDYKIRNAFERAQIFGLGTLNKGMTIANVAKDKVSSFTSEQISRYRMWRIDREKRAYEKDREKSIRRAEERETEERRKRNLEHKKAMAQLLKEQDRDILDSEYEKMHEEKKRLIESLVAEKNRLLNISSESEQNITSRRSR